MAETEDTSNCIRLELGDGGHVYLRSIWHSANFSIAVFDGFQAWSRSVSTKEVVSIARQWNIDVGEFMRSARARLSCQHATSSYSISAERDADIVNLSFTIDDLLEGKALDLKLRMEGVSDMRPVVCEMLDYLADTNDMLKEQLIEAENQFQKKLRQFAAVSEPEPSITLSLARSSGNNPQRQSSSFLEPRLLDFSNFKPLEDRDPPPHPGCTRTHGQQLLHDTSENTSTWQPPSLNLHDHGITKPTTNSNLETEREVSYFKNRVSAQGGRMTRNNELTLNMVALSPEIIRVLNSLSNGMDLSHGASPNLHDCRDEGPDIEDGDKRGLKITEMRSPRREDQPQRSSFMPETNSVSTTVSARALRHKITTPENIQSDIARDSPQAVKKTGIKEGRAYKMNATMIRKSTFSGIKETQENHNDTVSGIVLEKDSSNVGDKVKSRYAAVVEAKEAGSDEERTSKVTSEDAQFCRSALDSDLRVKAGLSGQSFPRGQPLNEAKHTEEKHEKCEDPQNTTAADTEPESRASGRQKSPAETTGKQSSVSRECLWDKDIIDAVVAAPSASKSEKVTESYTEEEDDDDEEEEDNDDDEEEDDDDEEEQEQEQETPVYAHRMSTRARSPGANRRGRKRSVEDREESKGLRPMKVKSGDLDLGGTDFTARRTRRSNTIVKQEVELDDYREEVLTTEKHEMERGSFQKKQDGGPPGYTIAALIRLNEGKRDKTPHADAAFRPPEKKHRHGDHDDGSLYEEENVAGTNVPDPDYFDFDKERTEDRVKADQIWAVYSEKDEMPRSYARIDKVFSVPRFKALVTWLKPHQPSERAKQWSELSGYTVSWGEFEDGGQGVLNGINFFSHRVMIGSLFTKVVKIYPRKGEIWAVFKKMENQSSPTPSHTGTSKGRFRLVEITEDVEAGIRPEILVLGRVPGFRTIWQAGSQKGALPTADLTLFSHRVPAYRLQGHELKGKNLKGGWDIDPAGLSPADSQGDV